MSFFRSFLFLCLVCILASSGLIFWGSTQNFNEYRGGFAALSVDEKIEDRPLYSLLNSGNKYFAGSPVSESSQWVMLNEFGSLAMIPLDEYSTRITPFDPRNDGYADKLKDIFVKDGKRWVFIPIRTGNTVPSLFEKQLTSLLGDISFTVKYFNIKKSYLLFFILFTAASVCLLFICYVQKNNHPGTGSMVPVLPPLSSLAFFGASGIACAALLLGLAAMLREPLNELILLLHPPLASEKKKQLYKNVFEPFKLYWFFLLLFPVSLAAIVYFSDINPWYVLIVSVIVCFLYFFSIRTFSSLSGNHKRFSPVMIIKRRFPDFAFSVYMLPITIAAFLAMLFTPSLPGALASNENFDQIIDEREYYEHLAFQASFSVQQLGKKGSRYPGYVMDTDGLPIPDNKDGANPTVQFDEYPPFPLKSLMDFLGGVNTENKTINNRGIPRGNLLPLLLLVFIFPLFFLKQKPSSSKKGSFSALNRPAGRRRTDIDRKKTLLYNNKNTLRILKDA